MRSSRSRSRRGLRILVAPLALALVLAACGDDDGDTEPAPADEVTEDDDADDADDVEEEADEPAAEEDPAEVEGPEVTLTLGHPFPGGHLIQANALEAWADEVNAVTNGTVTIEFHPGGALAAPDATYENAAAGAMDIGWALHGYTPGRFPLTDVVELPFVFENAVSATGTLWDLYEEFPELQDEYSDVKVLALWTHDIGNLYTVDREVNGPEDMAGLNLRAPGPMQTRLIEALGGDGVGLPAGELYDSLERGVIDGLMIADTGVGSFTLHEVLSYGLHANFYVAGQFLVMSLDSWDQLSESQQAAIDAVSLRELSMTAAQAYDNAHANTLPLFNDDWGMQVQLVEDVDIDVWRDAAAPVAEGWIADREADGQPGQAMFDRLMELTGN